MISRPLREDTRHAAAAVVGMRDTYCSFQAEVVGQDTLKLGLREREGLYVVEFRREFCAEMY